MSQVAVPAGLHRFAGLLVAVALLAGLALSLKPASAQIAVSDITISDRNNHGHFTINIDGTLGQLQAVADGSALEVSVTAGSGSMVLFHGTELTPALGTTETATLAQIASLRDDITTYDADGPDDVAGNADDDAAKSIPPVHVYVLYPAAAYTTATPPLPATVTFTVEVNLADTTTTRTKMKTTEAVPETPSVSFVGALRQDADGELSAGQTTQLTVGLQAVVAFNQVGPDNAKRPAQGGGFTTGTTPGENAKTCVTADEPTDICPGDLGRDSYIQLSGPATFTDGSSLLRGGLSLNCENNQVATLFGSSGETGGTCYIVHDHDGDDPDGNGMNGDGGTATAKVAPSITVASGADSDVTVFASFAVAESADRFHVQLSDNNMNRRIYAANTGTYYNLNQSSYFGRYVIPVTAVEQIDEVTLGPATGQATTVGTSADVNLLLGIRNSDGQPSDVNAISSVTITTTSGQVEVGNVAGGTQFCTAASTCNIPILTSDADDTDLTGAATTTPSLIGAIPVTLGGVSKAGTATVSATVVAKAGSSQPIYRAEPITITFSGGASSIMLGGDTMPRVLNRKDETANSIADEDPGTVAANLDEASFSATATDSRNVASTLPRAVTATAIGPDGATVSSGITLTPDAANCGPGRGDASKCKYTVTVTAEAAQALPAGTYKLRLAAAGLTTAETEFGVAGPPAKVEIETDEPGGVGSTFGATITVTDADGEKVADGTEITISVNARDAERGSPIRLINPAPATSGDDEGKGKTRTANGVARATFTVVGREVATVNAQASDEVSGIAVIDTSEVAAAVAAAPSEGLSSTEANGFATWRGIGFTTASDLLDDLDGISSIRLWNGKRWIAYGVADGQELPGAFNFDIGDGDNLWLGG